LRTPLVPQPPKEKRQHPRNLSFETRKPTKEHSKGVYDIPHVKKSLPEKNENIFSVYDIPLVKKPLPEEKRSEGPIAREVDATEESHTMLFSG
jgi:hypothetical protein